MRSCLRWTAAVLALTLAGCAEQPTGVPANGDAGNEAARRYINGELDAKGAAGWLERYALYSPPRAAQRV